MTDDPGARPEVKLRPRHQRRVRAGHPWVYSNEIVMDETERSLAPGSLVTVVADDGRRLGVATFNPHTLVSLRILARDPGRNIDREFLAGRLKRALKLRESFYEEPFYRLVHGEADELVPAAALARAVEGLEAAGVPVESHIRPGLGHGMDSQGIILGGRFLSRAFAA